MVIRLKALSLESDSQNKFPGSRAVSTRFTVLSTSPETERLRVSHGTSLAFDIAGL